MVSVASIFGANFQELVRILKTPAIGAGILLVLGAFAVGYLLSRRERSAVLGLGTAQRNIAGAMIWVTILFSGMLGLGRSFSLEKEQDAMVGVLLTPVGRGALFFGKFLANLALLSGATLVVYLVYALFFQLSLTAPAAGLAAVTFLAVVGFMALGTLFSAIAASTRLGDTLLPIVLLPLLIPVVFFGASAVQRLILGRPFEEIAGSVRMLAAFDLLFLFVCTMLFGKVVEE